MFDCMARGFRCGVQCTIHLLRSSSSPSFQHSMSLLGLMGSFNCSVAGGGGGGGEPS